MNFFEIQDRVGESIWSPVLKVVKFSVTEDVFFLSGRAASYAVKDALGWHVHDFLDEYEFH